MSLDFRRQKITLKENREKREGEGEREGGRREKSARET